MAIHPTPIQTYHCICTSLLLATTHTLSTLPRRAPPSLDGAYILPVPSQAPSFSRSPSPNIQVQDPDKNEEPDSDAMDAEQKGGEIKALPAAGYTLLLGMQKDAKITIIRREDGFEKRLLYRCTRCNLTIGYEIPGSSPAASGADAGKDSEGFEGKIVYLLPNGVLSTGAMVQGTKIGEGDVEVGREGRGVWE